MQVHQKYMVDYPPRLAMNQLDSFVMLRKYRSSCNHLMHWLKISKSLDFATKDSSKDEDHDRVSMDHPNRWSTMCS